MLRWSVEIGMIGILTEASCLSHYLCYPIEGHLNYLYNIFSCLHKNMDNIPGGMTHNPMHDITNKNISEVSGKYLD